jgi:hypothetical protein
MTIYYCYDKKTGKFYGSGTTHIDNEMYGCTEVPYPSYNNITHMPYWKNGSWEILPK